MKCLLVVSFGGWESEPSFKSGSEKRGKEEAEAEAAAAAGSSMISLSFSGFGPINVSGTLHMHLYYIVG